MAWRCHARVSATRPASRRTDGPRRTCQQLRRRTSTRFACTNGVRTVRRVALSSPERASRVVTVGCAYARRRSSRQSRAARWRAGVDILRVVKYIRGSESRQFLHGWHVFFFPRECWFAFCVHGESRASRRASRRHRRRESRRVIRARCVVDVCAGSEFSQRVRGVVKPTLAVHHPRGTIAQGVRSRKFEFARKTRSFALAAVSITRHADGHGRSGIARFEGNRGIRCRFHSLRPTSFCKLPLDL